MPRFLNQITEEGNSVPSSSNNTVNDIIYVTQEEFDTLVSQNKLIEGTIYMIDESGGGSELDGCPIGAIVMWAASSVPTGWTICDGKATPSDADSSFKTLFSNNVPDLRNKFVVGVGTETEFNALAKTGGSKYIQAHTHSDKCYQLSAIRGPLVYFCNLNQQGLYSRFGYSLACLAFLHFEKHIAHRP